MANEEEKEHRMRIQAKNQGHMYHVILNGEKLFNCIEADDEAGWARCYRFERLQHAENGSVRHFLITERRGEREFPIEEIKCGHVEVIPISDQPMTE